MTDKWTRRSALGLMAGGASLLVWDSSGFTTLDADRRTSVGITADDQSDLKVVGIDGGEKTLEGTTFSDPFTISVTNNYSDTIKSGNLTLDISKYASLNATDDSGDVTLSEDTSGVFSNDSDMQSGDEARLQVENATSGSVNFTVDFTGKTASGVTVSFQRSLTIEYTSGLDIIGEDANGTRSLSGNTFSDPMTIDVTNVSGCSIAQTDLTLTLSPYSDTSEQDDGGDVEFAQEYPSARPEEWNNTRAPMADGENARLEIDKTVAGSLSVTVTFDAVYGSCPSENFDRTFTIGSNQSPTGNVTADKTSVTVGETVSFDGTGSSDSDGTITSYDWDFGDGNTGSGETTTHSYSSTGDYTVTLTVTDDGGATDTETVTISVSSGTTTLWRIDDLSSKDQDHVEFYVSYDATGVSNADSVEFYIDNSKITTDSSAPLRGRFEDTRAGYGSNFDIEIKVKDSGGSVLETRSITETADTTNPSGNNDPLAEGDSATLDSSTITDKGSANYDFDYTVSSTGKFGSIDLLMRNKTGQGGYDTVNQTTRSDQNVSVSTYGSSHEFKLALLVFDDHGAVVNDRIVTDTADGTDP